MSDIFRAIGIRDFSTLPNEAIATFSNTYGDAAAGINHALKVIGNLLAEININEDYLKENAKRDLLLIGSALRHLPELSWVLAQNSNFAERVLEERKTPWGKGE